MLLYEIMEKADTYISAGEWQGSLVDAVSETGQA
jgi:hypothetical protein